jgi:hypothetical protein
MRSRFSSPNHDIVKSKKPGLLRLFVLVQVYAPKPGFSNSAIAALEPKAIGL